VSLCYIPAYRYRKPCPLSLRARVVYSYLAYRARLGHGASLAELREALPLSHGARDAVRELAGYDLARCTAAERCTARPPADPVRDWFVWLDKVKPDAPWPDRMNRYRFHLQNKTSPLSLQGLALLNVLVDMDKQDKLVSRNGLAAILASHPRTVARQVRALEGYGLVAVRPVGTGRYDVTTTWPPPPALAGWFRLPDSLPAWEVRLRESGVTDRRVSRVRALAETLSRWYHDTYYTHPVTYEQFESLDTILTSDVERAIKEWDRSQAPNPGPLAQNILAERVERMRRWERRSGCRPPAAG
jgi:hypothetical protein